MHFSNEISGSDAAMLNIALKVAEANDEYLVFRFGGVLCRGGSVLSIGWNRFRNDPNNVEEPKFQAGIHAEVNTLRQARDPKSATLYVARVTPGGRQAIAMPCPACAEALFEAGVKRVVWTTDHNGAQFAKPADIISYRNGI